MFSTSVLIMFLFPFTSLNKESMLRLVSTKDSKEPYEHFYVAVNPSWTEAETVSSMFTGDGGRCRNVVPRSCPQIHISQRLKGSKVVFDKCPKYLSLKDLDLIIKNKLFGTISNCLIGNISLLAFAVHKAGDTW